MFAQFSDRMLMDCTLFSSRSPFAALPRLRSLLVLAMLLAGSAVVTTGCSDGEASNSSSDTPSRPNTRVETVMMEPTSFRDVIEVTGTVEALDDATLSAQTNGPVTMLLDRGARVDAGEPVAKINSDEARAAVEQAEAQYDLAQDRFERQKPLYQDSIISALEFEQVRSERNQARASLQQAQTRLSNAILEAPFAGTVEERFLEVGEQAAPGTQLARLVNTRRVKVTAGVPERYANDLQQGDSVRVRIQSASMEDRWGRIVFVGSTIDAESRTFSIEVELTNPDRLLKPEMVAKLFVVRERLRDVLVAPRSAVSRNEDGLTAYTVTRTDSGAVVRSNDITLGAASGNKVVVESGLDPGAELITVGRTDVAEGDVVNVVSRHRRVDAATRSDASDEDSPPALPSPDTAEASPTR